MTLFPDYHIKPKLYSPHIPLFISGDTAGNATRQAESDQINRTQDRIVDTQKVIDKFKKLIEDSRDHAD
jgi:hypothetical protein